MADDTTTTEETETLSFRAPKSFKRQLRHQAIHEDRTLSELAYEVFRLDWERYTDENEIINVRQDDENEIINVPQDNE